VSNESPAVKIVVPDAGPINTLAAAGLLDLLLAPKNVRLVLVDAIVREVVSQSDPLRKFIERFRTRIEIATTDAETNVQAMISSGIQPKLRHVGEQAMVEFVMHGIADVVKDCPALVIFEDKRLPKFHAVNSEFGSRTHLMTTAAYLRKLAQHKIIDSFDETWERIVQANIILDPSVAARVGMISTTHNCAARIDQQFDLQRPDQTAQSSVDT
jgi:hypothetical protein